MQKKIIKATAIYLVLFCFSINSYAIHKSETVQTVVNTNDSVVLRLNDYVGDIQWQLYTGNSEWESLSGEVFDTLLFVADTTTLFRAKVVAGSCEPFYSDEIFVAVRPACPEQPIVTDFDGNVYQTVLINNQCWFVQNLRVTHYANGDPIEHLPSNLEWSNSHSDETGGWCWYNNDNQNEAVFGKLYNWYAVSDERNLCPPGWHVPTSQEWDSMVNYIGGGASSGGKLKSTGSLEYENGFWHNPNTGATNEIGFWGHPGGYRLFSGTFQNIGYSADWWTSTSSTTNYAIIKYLLHDSISVGTYSLASVREGFSVRCIKIIE